MNWEAIGASGELIGAMAVVVSVLYLAYQVRAQVRESRLAAMHEVSDAFHQHQAGRLSELLWVSINRQYSALLNWPGFQWVWSIRRDFFTSDFAAYVDTVEPGDHPI